MLGNITKLKVVKQLGSEILKQCPMVKEGLVAV